jgi:hypothetical protein
LKVREYILLFVSTVLTTMTLSAAQHIQEEKEERRVALLESTQDKSTRKRTINQSTRSLLLL